MTTTTKFNLVSHYTGEASTANSVVQSLNSSFSGSSTISNDISYAKWRSAKQTDPPTLRFFRSFKTQSFIYLITLKPTTSAWQTRLDEIVIGYTRFVRPNHVHYVSGVAGSGIKNNIWPQRVFTAWGSAYVLADRDWMPRISITSVSAGSPVDFDASMTLWRIGNSRLDITDFGYYTTARADATPTTNLAAPTSPFAFSRHV